MRKLELLAPARDLECGKAAIDHGADAVYIGASRFGARSAACNSLEDIGALCVYAHQFGAKVYVTLNTIIYDAELDEVFGMIGELSAVGVDALLVQDMALVGGVKGNDLGIPLHASTQTDNRTAEKVGWLHGLGFRRVVLARELSLEEIKEIHCKEPDVELEVFVHGALCVSYSGQCYMSQYCEGRSANRGECAQLCRMRYDLVDSAGRELVHQRHLLSLKDLCRIDDLEAFADAGVMSFKIEGRLKDVTYVKNVVAAYSERLDELCRKRPSDFCRASLGHVKYFFEPNLWKTFNRGFTDYFLYSTRDEGGRLLGRRRDIISPDTPKALGEFVGTVKRVFFGAGGSYIVVAGTAAFANGDGLCFFKEVKGVKDVKKLRSGMVGCEESTELVGFRVNRAEGNRLFPLKMPEGLREGMALWRNKDVAFERLMGGKTAERKIPVRMTLRPVAGGFELCAMIVGGSPEDSVAVAFSAMEKQIARKPQRENIVGQLSRLGETPYACSEVVFEGDADRYFIPSSRLSELRRQCVAVLAGRNGGVKEVKELRSEGVKVEGFPSYSQSYLFNIANWRAREFYESHGLRAPDPAFELKPSGGALLMQCRHCLRFTLGGCPFEGVKGVEKLRGEGGWLEPLYLRLSDGRRFRLEFDCSQCQMNILSS